MPITELGAGAAAGFRGAEQGALATFTSCSGTTLE